MPQINFQCGGVQVTYLGHDSSTTWTDYAIEWNDYEVRTHTLQWECNIGPGTMGIGLVCVHAPYMRETKASAHACLSLPHRFHCRALFPHCLRPSPPHI